MGEEKKEKNGMLFVQKYADASVVQQILTFHLVWLDFMLLVLFDYKWVI